MTTQESAALNMAKFIRTQSLLLLEKLDILDLDEEATTCEKLHEGVLRRNPRKFCHVCHFPA